MTRQATFVLLTTQRSGSGWLVDLLDDHPAVVAYDELFRVTDTTVARHGATRVPRFEVMVGPSVFSTSAGLVPKRRRYVRGLARAHPDARAVGFKLMYDQTRDHPGLLSTLALMRARFVHLVRRDSLSAIVSFDIAHARDRWHYHLGDAVRRPRVRADTASLLRRLQERDDEIERFRRMLSRLPAPVHEVVYEDLVAQRDDVLGGLLDFLGAPAATRPLRSTLVRPVPGRTVDLVENRDAVQAALAGTDYEWLAA